MRKRATRAFDPVDLEIIERAFEGALAELSTLSPLSDPTQLEARKEALRRRAFVAARDGKTNTEALQQRILRGMIEYWLPEAAY